MSQARFTSTGRAYGLKRVCALWGLARSGVRPLGLGALHGLRATAARGGPRS